MLQIPDGWNEVEEIKSADVADGLDSQSGPSSLTPLLASGRDGLPE